MNRTEAQNNSLHLWLEQVAMALNDAGYDMTMVVKAFKDGYKLPCTKENLKEVLWRPTQKGMYLKQSTTQLDKEREITQIHKVISKFLGEKFGLEYIPFPSMDSLSTEDIELKTK